MSHVAPLPLVEYPDEELLEETLPKEGCLCGRTCFQIFQATVSFAVFSAVVGVLASDVLNARSSHVSRALLGGLGGFSIGWLFPSILSEKRGNAFKSVVSDYATPIFLIVSQIYLNMTENQRSHASRGVFGFFNIQGGIALAAYIHSVIHWRLGTGIDLPLSAQIDEPEKEVSHLKMAVDTSAKRITSAGMITAIGVAAIFTGVLYPQAKLFRDFGIILSGNSMGRILSEMWWMAANWKFSKESTDYFLIDDESRYSWVTRYYSTINRVILIAFHALPGALIVGAEIAAQKELSPLSMTIFAIAGIVIGWNEHLRQTRFTEVPIEDLHEVRINRERIFPPKSIFGAVKWFIGTPCTLTFIGLTLAGYNPDQNQFQKVDPYIISAMTMFAVTLYTSYFFSEWARTAFKKEPNHRIINTAYHFTHYSLGVPLVFIYIMEKLLINDEVLNLDGPYAGVMATLAYGSLGWALGTEASSRFDSPNPRVVSSLYLALFTRYFFNHLFGED